MKVCTKCKVEKEFIEFSKDKSKKDNYCSRCKSCNKKYNLENKEKIREYDKKYYLDNIEQEKQYNKQYRIENKDKSKQYRLDNKEHINKRNNIYNKNRRKTDSLFKLKGNTRNLIGMSIKRQGYSKKSRTYEILGCSYEEFKQHLENQFTEGMTWENAGQWELDHIYPVSLATDEQHLIKLNHYTNFQPLWAEDNNRKSNKI